VDTNIVSEQTDLAEFALKKIFWASVRAARFYSAVLFLNDGPSRGAAVQTFQCAARNLTVRAQRAVFVKTSNSTNSPFILVPGLRAILFPSMACLLERQTQLFPFAESDGTRRLAAWS
jgi:hypothetical protein